MIKFQELKIGDYVFADNDGDIKPGEIVNLNGDEKQACVDTGQAFWYEMNQLTPIPIDENALNNLKFHKEINEDGTVKFLKGAFRILVPREGDFSRMEIWYRDETRHIMTPISVHNLQNHFYDMTKVYLNEESFG